MLVAGMIAVAVATGVLTVAQTWLSNVVGQRVMHDLRAQVYRHLQRLSLAPFFTHTRTGEIQSRIANDIGGVQNVVTNTATSIVSNVTTVIATVVGDAAARLAARALLAGHHPRLRVAGAAVGAERRRIATIRQGAMADISSLVQESLSVSGILLGKTMGRGPPLAERFSSESERLAELEVRSAHGRALGDVVHPDLVRRSCRRSSTCSPGSPKRCVDRHDRRLHHAADAAPPPIESLVGVSVDIESLRLRCSSASSSTSTCPFDLEPGERELKGPASQLRFDDVSFRYDEKHQTLSDIDLTVPADMMLALVGETGSGKTTLGDLAARLYDPDEGAVRLDGTDVRELTFGLLTDAIGVVSQET